MRLDNAVLPEPHNVAAEGLDEQGERNRQRGDHQPGRKDVGRREHQDDTLRRRDDLRPEALRDRPAQAESA